MKQDGASTSQAAPPAGASAIESARLDLRLLASLMAGLFVAGLDGSMLNIMLPMLQGVFETSASNVMLLATIYLTVLASFQLFFGRCADLLSSIRVFFFGQVIFFVGSAVCAVSSSLGVMLAGRAIQGLGGAMLAASFGAVILRHFPRHRTGQIVGWAIMVMGVGTIIGPPLGGFLAQYASWRWAFLVNLPLCFVGGALLLPRLGFANREGSASKVRLGLLDPAGTVWSILMVASLPMIFQIASSRGWASPETGVAALVFLSSLIFFVRTEKRVLHPLLPSTVLRDSRLGQVVIVKLLIFCVLNGLLLIFPFYLTRSVGMDVDHAGWIMLALAATMTAATPVVGALSDRVGSGRVMSWGAPGVAALVGGAFLLGQSPPDFILIVLLAGLGAAITFVLIATTVQILHLAPTELAGVYSAVNSVIIGVGGSLGLSLFSYLYSLGTGPSLAYSGLRFGLIGAMTCAAAMIILTQAFLRRGPVASPERQVAENL